MSWNWSNVYPGTRVLTVIMAPGDADALMAMPGVRVVGEHVVLIEHFETPSKPLQATVNAPSKAPPKPVKQRNRPSQKPATAVQHGLVREAKSARAQVRKQPVAPATTSIPATRQQTSTPRTINDDLPAHRQERERPSSAITKQDIALVEKVIASGTVTITKCPSNTYTPEDEVGSKWGWRGGKGQVGRRVKAKRGVARQRVEAQQEAEGA